MGRLSDRSQNFSFKSGDQRAAVVGLFVFFFDSKLFHHFYNDADTTSIIYYTKIINIIIIKLLFLFFFLVWGARRVGACWELLTSHWQKNNKRGGAGECFFIKLRISSFLSLMIIIFHCFHLNHHCNVQKVCFLANQQRCFWTHFGGCSTSIPVVSLGEYHSWIGRRPYRLHMGFLIQDLVFNDNDDGVIMIHSFTHSFTFSLIQSKHFLHPFMIAHFLG